MVSPGVSVQEIDLTGYIPAVATSIGAYAGHFRWGPCDEVLRISDEKQLAQRFGTPTPKYSQSYHIPSTFLRYGERLLVSRAKDSDMQSARSGDVQELLADYYTDKYDTNENIEDIIQNFISSEDAPLIENKRIFESITASELQSTIYARCPGEMGNSIQVMLQPAHGSSRWNVVQLEVVEGVFSDTTVAITVQNRASAWDEDGNVIEWEETLPNHAEISLRALASRLDWVNWMEQLGRRFFVKKIVVDGEDDTFVDNTYGEAMFGILDAKYTKYRIYLDRKCEVEFNPTTIYQRDEFGRTFAADDAPTAGQVITTQSMSEGFLYWPPQAEDFESAFVTRPGTSAYAAERGISSDEIHVLIIDKYGDFTGTPGLVLERYDNVSLLSDAKREDGSTMYYKDVINTSSNYIFINNLTGVLTGADTASSEFEGEFTNSQDFGGVCVIHLVNGEDGSFKNGNVFRALEHFEDPEEIDINLLFAENDTADNITIANKLIKIAERRKDCVAFISPDIAVKDMPNDNAMLERVLRKFNRLPSTSYAVFDSTPIQVYDKYNDAYIWTTACGTVAGLCARTDKVRDPWWSPAGYSRGQLLGVAKTAFNPKQFARDELYKSRVNPIVAFPGEGTILYGDKTAQTRPSAFDRINVRRLFIVLQKAISTAAKYSLFEFNDEFTRAQFKNMVDPYLRDVKGRRGIYDFLVVCDETNNTGEVIDTNRFVADIYIKPARAINFINLHFIATRTGVEFSEVIGKW